MPTRVFRYWTGDDTDASIAVDADGALYVGVEYERHTTRSERVGQMIKLDPGRPDHPLVWKVYDRAPVLSGVSGSPALYRDIAIFDTHHAEVLGIDRATGDLRWRFRLREATWQSPVVVDDVLLIGDCGGDLHAYDVADTRSQPRHLWTLRIGSCIESTPTVWNGTLYFGTRAGAVHAIGLR